MMTVGEADTTTKVTAKTTREVNLKSLICESNGCVENVGVQRSGFAVDVRSEYQLKGN
jgi:hypothetical protein